MDPFSLAIPLGLIGPALIVGVFAYFWRGFIRHIGMFMGIGGLASYILMAMCLTRALADVGLTGNLSAGAGPSLDPLLIRYLSFMLIWLAASVLALFVTRRLLAKKQLKVSEPDE